MSPQISFVGPSYQARSAAVASDVLLNMFPETRDVPKPGTTEIAALYNVPGTTLFADIDAGVPCRGMYTTTSGRLFTVIGGTLWEVFIAGTFVARGSLPFRNRTVAMADNGAELCLTDGLDAYILTLSTNVLTPIAQPGFVPGNSVDFVDGYFVMPRLNTGQWAISALYDGLSWDVLEFMSAEGSPDPIVKLAVLNRIIWAFGTQTVQGYFNAGTLDFPFAILQGSEMTTGLYAPDTLQRLGDGGLVWLGLDEGGARRIFRLHAGGGIQLERVSTHAIELALEQTPALETAAAWTTHESGHYFYCLSTQTHTWCWDLATAVWHERGVLNASGTIVPLPIRHGSVAFLQQYLGDSTMGRLYLLDAAVYSYAGAIMPSVRQWQGTAEESGDVFHHGLEIYCETGVGLNVPATALGYEPQMTMQFSDDRGKTWSMERQKSLGRLGQYDLEVRWNRLGKANVGRIYRVSVTDPVKRVWYGAELRATGAQP